MKKNAQLAVLVLVMLAGLYSIDYVYSLAENAVLDTGISGGMVILPEYEGSSITVEKLTKPIIGAFTAQPATINKGQQATLMWTGIKNADSCEIVADGTRIELIQRKLPILNLGFSSGAKKVTPEKTTTYQLNCYKKEYVELLAFTTTVSTSSEVTVTVKETETTATTPPEQPTSTTPQSLCQTYLLNGLQVICTTAYPEMYYGKDMEKCERECREVPKTTETEATETTSTTSEEKCQLKGDEIYSYYSCTTNNIKYDDKLNCIRNCGKETSTTTPTPPEQPTSTTPQSLCQVKDLQVICTTAYPKMYYGKDMAACKRECKEEPKTTTGSTAEAEKPTIGAFTAQPATINKGQQATLMWTGIKNAEYCYIMDKSGNSVDWKMVQNIQIAQESIVVTPEKTTKYELTCYKIEPDTTTTISTSLEATVTVTETSTTPQGKCQIEGDDLYYYYSCTTNNIKYDDKLNCIRNCGKETSKTTPTPPEQPTSTPITTPQGKCQKKEGSVYPYYCTTDNIEYLRESDCLAKCKEASTSGQKVNGVDLVVKIEGVVDKDSKPVDELVTGESYKVRIKVSNIGDTAPPSWILYIYNLVYLDTNQNLGTSLVFQGLNSIETSELGEGPKLEFSWTVPEALKAGEYDLVAKTDTALQVAEVDEANNKDVKKVKIVKSGEGSANLIVEDVEVVPSAGNVFGGVKATIRNNGGKSALIGDGSQQKMQDGNVGGISFVMVDAKIEKDGAQVCSGRGFIYSTLGARASTEVTVPMGQCSLKSGSSYTINAVVDSGEWLFESNDNDNSLRKTFSLPADSAAEVNCPENTVVGFRTGNKYCDSRGKLVAQKADWQSCENSFECASNVCGDGKCIEGSIFRKILEYFSKIY